MIIIGLNLGIDCREIKVKLTCMFRFEGNALKFYHYIAFEACVIKKQVDKKFIAIYF